MAFLTRTARIVFGAALAAALLYALPNLDVVGGECLPRIRRPGAAVGIVNAVKRVESQINRLDTINVTSCGRSALRI